MYVTGKPKPNPLDNTHNRFKLWSFAKTSTCRGKAVRSICIFSIPDLPYLAQRPEMFANKFNLDFHPIAYDCMEELHYNITRAEMVGDRIFDTAKYKDSDFVKHHI